MTDSKRELLESRADGVTLEAELRDEVEALTAERFGPLPRREADHEGKRLRFIATMHALIGWLVEHPEMPAPWSSGMNIYVPDQAALDAYIETNPGASVWCGGVEGGPAVQATLFNVDGAAEFYTPITVSISKDQRL